MAAKSDQTGLSIYYSIMPYTRCASAVFNSHTLCTFYVVFISYSVFFFCFLFFAFSNWLNHVSPQPAGSRLVRSDLHIEYDDGIIESQPRTKLEAYAKVNG